MPRKKLPDEAFSYYVGLGTGRSYAAVAKEYGVNKRTVTARAKKERWQERVETLERQVRADLEQQAKDELAAMSDRHLKYARILQKRAVEAFLAQPLENQRDIIRALDLGCRTERLIRGEPSERHAVSIEDTIRREYERWMRVPGQDDADDANDAKSGDFPHEPGGAP